MQYRILGTAFVLAGAASAQTQIQLPDSIWSPTDSIVWVKKVASFCEGPAWDAATNSVFFTRQIGNQAAHWPIYRVRPGVDTGALFIDTSYQANGLDFDPQGRLVAVQNGRITRYKADGTTDTTLVVSGSNGVAFNSSNGNQANDLSIGSNGAFYFTALGSQVLYVNPQRQLSVAYSGATSANGIEWIEEDSAVYVNESRVVKRYRVNADGTLSNPQTFITVAAGSGGTYADGGAVDKNGNRYIANFQQGELRVYNAQGDSIGRIVMRMATGTSFDAFTGNMGNVSNAAFGGPDLKTLYLTGDGGLYSIRLKIPGRVRPGTPTSLRALVRPAKRPSIDGALRDVRGRALGGEARPEAFNAPGFKTQGPNK